MKCALSIIAFIAPWAAIVRECPAEDFLGAPAQWYWEGSIDGGTSWTRHMMTISDSTPAVQIRARCEFVPTSPVPSYYGAVSFDPFVSGTSAGDSILQSSINAGEARMSLPVVVSRIGDVLKIDQAVDTLPPGQGPRFTSSVQTAPTSNPNPVMSNPITVFAYTLQLEGRRGTRVVDAAFYQGSVFGPSQYLITFKSGGDFLERFNVYYHELQDFPLTISVVPAPSAVALGGFASLVALRRRRRA